MKDIELKYWIAFSRIKGIGRVRFAKMESHFGNLSEAWHASGEELAASDLDAAAIKSIVASRSRISPDDELANMRRLGIEAHTCHDDNYPKRLREIYDYPPLIYVKGTLQPNDTYCVAIVGSRKLSAYGRQISQELAQELAANGITVVSGLARGVDTAAHQGALNAGGRTLAVLGSGVDHIYPGENTTLAGEIVAHGALISEYPPGTKPRPDYFPRRNRILSGLSLGVLVTEADENSGALITARHALEQNREVFAVPGSILTVTSRGSNRLIQEGAKLVTNISDILQELNLSRLSQAPEEPAILPTADSDDETMLLNNLTAEPRHIDELCRLTGLPVAQVSSTLVILEIKGMAKQVGAMNYVLEQRLRETALSYKVKVE
jgi:DNA processing protein